jgi:pimeloyl-ACP methyl ester carboxylesterase
VAQQSSTSYRFWLNGRYLKVEEAGAPDGTPVVLMHGTPGSRLGPRPRSSVLYRLGVRLISYDRPGYGGSTRNEGRIIADAADDVAAIADQLDIEQFAVVGRSGGGPHALACAALLGHRVTRTAVLVGVAPVNAPGLDWYEGMAPGNVDDHATAGSDPPLLAKRLAERAVSAVHDLGSLVDELRAEMHESDRLVIDDVAIWRLVAEAHAEALRRGPYGWLDDVKALRRDWGFRLDNIKTPVRLWHGKDDTFAPVSHTLWMEKQLVNADVDVEVQPGTAHFGAMEILPRLLPWLTGDDPRDMSKAALSDVRTGAGR